MLPIVIALIAVPAVVGLAELTRRGFSARRFRLQIAAAATQPEGTRFATVRVLRSGAEVNDAVARAVASEQAAIRQSKARARRYQSLRVVNPTSNARVSS